MNYKIKAMSIYLSLVEIATGLTAAPITSFAKMKGPSIEIVGPYSDHVQCFKGLQGKSETPNTNNDSEFFLPGSLDQQTGIFWFDKSGQSHFFDLAVDLPELEEFRKESSDDAQWIADVRSMKRLNYKDPDSKEAYRYGFFLRVLHDDKFKSLRFVWLKDTDFKTNREIKYQSISQFNQTLMSVRKKYGRRILSRTMVSVARKPVDHSLASLKRGNRHPYVEKLILDELKKKVETVYFSYRQKKSIERSSLNTNEYVSAIEQCQSIGDPGLNAVIRGELSKFDVLPSAHRGLATSSGKSNKSSK